MNLTELASPKNSEQLGTKNSGGLELADYDENAWFDPKSGLPDGKNNFVARALKIISMPETMDSLENLVRESYKFIRMADDLHNVAHYLNDMRYCFIALTLTGYILIALYCVMYCIRRNRRPTNANNGNLRRGRWDYQADSRDYPAHPQTDDLVSVRSDGQGLTATHMGRNHHRNPPLFMRHGMNHAQQTARLMPDQDGGVIKHQIPHITTDPPSSDEATPPVKVPELVKGSIEM